MNNGPFPESSVFGAEGCLYYYQGSVSTDKPTSPQKEIILNYFEVTLKEGFTQFIQCAPKSPIILKSLHAFLILKAMDTEPETYEWLINQYYPEVSSDSQFFVQNTYFRGLLKAFNKICKSDIDINHPLYKQIFNERLSPTKPNSPTKRNVVKTVLKKLVGRYISELEPNAEGDFISRCAQESLDAYTAELKKLQTLSTSLARRKLF